MKYLKKFESEAEYVAFLDSPEFERPNVSFINDSGRVFFSPLLSYIILDQNQRDPALMVSGGVNNKQIQLIRKHSHRYLGKYTSEGTMTICQLDDANSNYYADGSAAVLSGDEGDVFMKLPRFAYKAEELESNKWKIDFCYGDAPDTSWQQWDGNDLIGIYKASVSNSKLRSVRAGITTGNYDTLAAYAQNRGAGFSFVKWKHHNIMAVLFYALYGNTNSQTALGIGYSSDSNGFSAGYGMTDIVVSNKVSFWGLENWWGYYQEHIGNASVNRSAKTITITEDDGSQRVLPLPTTSGYISKMLIGEHLDLLPTEVSGSSKTYFCDYYSYNSYYAETLGRGGREANNDYLGISMLYAYYETDSSSYKGTARLAFRGSLIEENNPEAFKSLTEV